MFSIFQIFLREYNSRGIDEYLVIGWKCAKIKTEVLWPFTKPEKAVEELEK